ncbi:MAG TPA: thiosulfate oxidation carrier complex protein SoxZ [Usitatibacteraceae bacterium]
MSNFRLSVPTTAKRGELVPIRLIIQHPMETGFRLDAAGKAYTKNVIHDIACRYNGVEVLRMELSSGIAANPYLEFFARAEASGEIAIDWIDDAGDKGQARAAITVS